MTSNEYTPLDAPAAPVKKVALWEDFIDIFYAPSMVYERRKNTSPWPMIFLITIIFAAITILTFNALSPLIDIETRAGAAKMMAKNPQMTQDMVESTVKWQMGARRFGGVFFPIGVMISGLFVWLLAKIIGLKEMTYQRGMIVSTYASLIALVQVIVIGAQALVLDLSAMTSPDQLSFSVARFVDKAATSPVLYAIFKSLDVFNIWILIVTAIGVRVTGNGTKKNAIVFGVVWFVVSVLVAAAFGARQAAGG